MSVCGDSEDLAPSNPFLETEEKETPSDVSLQVLQVMTAIFYGTYFVYLYMSDVIMHLLILTEHYSPQNSQLLQYYKSKGESSPVLSLQKLL